MAASVFHEKRQTFSFLNGNHLLAMQERNGDMHSYSASADLFFFLLFSSLDENAGLTLPLKQWKTQLATDVIKRTLNVKKKENPTMHVSILDEWLTPSCGAHKTKRPSHLYMAGRAEKKHRPLIRRAASS